MTTASAPEPVPFTSADQYVGDRIALEMRRRRMTQIETGDALGMGQSSLSKKLTGERGWSLDELVIVSRYFTIPVEELLPGDDYEPRTRMRSVSNDEETPTRPAPGGGSMLVLPDFNDLRACRDSNPKPSDTYPLAPVVPIVAARSARRVRSLGLAGTCNPLDGQLATVYALARREVSA